jgi:hypothetical protein
MFVDSCIFVGDDPIVYWAFGAAAAGALPIFTLINCTFSSNFPTVSRVSLTTINCTVSSEGYLWVIKSRLCPTYARTRTQSHARTITESPIASVSPSASFNSSSQFTTSAEAIVSQNISISPHFTDSGWLLSNIHYQSEIFMKSNSFQSLPLFVPSASISTGVSGSSAGVIAGAVVGSIVMILAVAFIVFVFVSMKHRREQVNRDEHSSRNELQFVEDTFCGSDEPLVTYSDSITQEGILFPANPLGSEVMRIPLGMTLL